MSYSYAPWIIFNIFIVAMLALDLGYFNRHAHVISRREATLWSIFWIGLALIFCAGIHLSSGPEHALEFLTAYVIEKSLSVDNLFVMLVIFKMHHVTPKNQHRVLFFGILGALVMRSIMIVAGIKLIESFDWMLYIFGFFLIYAGVSTYLDRLPPGEEAPESSIVKWINDHLPIKKEDHLGQYFFLRENGKLYVTPLFVALIFIEFADLLFAVDSIPAVLAVSRDPFIVYTSNIFAILGLRSLYFMIADILPRFYFIHHALSLILIFVGIKMLLQDIYHIPIALSLSFILGVLVFAIFGSMLKEKLRR